MHASFPRRVDPWRAGAAATQFQGLIDASRLPRLRGVAVPSAPIEAWIGFAQAQQTRQELIRVEICVRGTYSVICQRCLEPMELSRAVNTQVLLAASEQLARQLEATAEVLICTPGSLLDPVALIEDEILLALPLAPVHDVANCLQRAVADPVEARVDGEPGASGTAPERENPFAVLAALKRRQRDE
jgi:uncharacterized protein